MTREARKKRNTRSLAALSQILSGRPSGRQTGSWELRNSPFAEPCFLVGGGGGASQKKRGARRPRIGQWASAPAPPMPKGQHKAPQRARAQPSERLASARGVSLRRACPSRAGSSNQAAQPGLGRYKGSTQRDGSAPTPRRAPRRAPHKPGERAARRVRKGPSSNWQTGQSGRTACRAGVLPTPGRADGVLGMQEKAKRLRLRLRRPPPFAHGWVSRVPTPPSARCWRTCVDKRPQRQRRLWDKAEPCRRQAALALADCQS